LNEITAGKLLDPFIEHLYEVRFVCISCFSAFSQTLDLLCHITNAGNVETVCEKLLSYLKTTADAYFRTELVDRITELAERYPFMVQLVTLEQN